MAKEAEELALQAARIRQLRDEKAHTEGRRVPQPEVAEAVGVRLRTYQLWEAGHSDPDPGNLEALAEYFGVSSDLIEYGPEGRPTPDLLSSRNGTRTQLDRIEEKLDALLATLTPSTKQEADRVGAAILRAGRAVVQARREREPGTVEPGRPD